MPTTGRTIASWSCVLILALVSCGGDPSVVDGEAGGGGSGATSGGGGAGQGGQGNQLNLPNGGGGSSAGGDGGTGNVDTTGCGDGLIQPGEVCDDSNSDAGDGCSADCKTIEQDFACPEPGQPCVSTVVCGDSLITGAETCDDGNDDPNDGCSASCQVEAGWQCAQPGYPCFAAECGDGIIAGNEECEDDDVVPTDNDGCSATCQREYGYACPGPGQSCYLTTCNDGIKEGDEPCDDGNNVIGDGCNPWCQVEPSCVGIGPCTSACGDGMILPTDNEQCDDGNTTNGDGCSANCMEEPGFTCNETLGQLPDTLEVPVTYRDFISLPAAGATRHPDFELYTGDLPTPGLVQTNLGLDGKPVYTGICEASLIGPCTYGQQTTSQADYDQWYRDTPGINITHVDLLSLGSVGGGTYYFPDADFYPLNNLGWVAQGSENPADNGNNYGFTSEVRTWFEFQGGESLDFSGDDDVWVFVNGQLALDLGGLHPPASGSFVLDMATASALGLVVGNVYEIVLFHAERHTFGSNFNLTLGGFVTAPSVCDTFCGDGTVAGDELCDDAVNDGSYGSCMPDCTPGPYCGDNILQEPQEVCDDGINLGVYSFTGSPQCAPGCVLGAYCGDAQINSLFGEQCDDGINAGGYNGCNADCTFGPKCGDGVVQADQNEQCDDGNTVSGDGCSKDCKLEGPK